MKQYKYLEYLEASKKSIQSNRAKRLSLNYHNAKDFSFTKTNSYDEAYEKAVNGWEAGIEKLKGNSVVFENGLMDFQHNVSGAYVDVGRYLSGQPNCMVEYVDETDRNKEELTIVIHCCYQEKGRPAKGALDYAKKALEIINQYQVDHNISLVVCFGVEAIRTDVVYVEIKGFDERLVFNSLAFSMHPSFFRRIHFKYLEGQENLISGYGYPINDQQMIREIAKYKKENNLGKVKYLPSYQENLTNWKKEQIIEI